MKKSVLISSFLVFTVLAAGYTGYSGAHTENGELTEVTSDNETKWNYNFKFQSSQASDKLNYSTYRNKTTISDIIKENEQCSKPKYSFNKTDEDSYLLSIYSPGKLEPNTVCNRAQTYTGYEASIKAKRPYKLEINNELGENHQIVNRKEGKAELITETDENTKNKGIIQEFIEFFMR